MYYNYLWLREDGTPYYTGKGIGNRAYIPHRRRANVTLYPPIKDRIILYPAESEAYAFEVEKFLIWYYGRKDLGTGCLRNMSNGGEQPPRPTPEAIEKIRITKTGQKHSAESIAKMMGCQNALGHVVSAEAREKIRAAKTGVPSKCRGQKRSAETRAKMSASQMGHTNSLGYKHRIESKAKMRAKKLGRVLSPETKARMSASQKRRREREKVVGEL
jgi:hypothetical protein